jgi:predicted amidohydrolase YtcJ
MTTIALPARVRLEGARFWTADPSHPWAQTLDIHDGRIAAVDAPARADTPVVTLPGLLVTPGLVDAHTHLSLGAETLAQVDLSGARNRAEFERAIAEAHAALAPGRWLRAHGWDDSAWGGERPTQDWLRAAGDRPVVAYRMDHHACVVNRPVLALLAGAACPAGGEIVRDAAGAATGLLLEQAAWRLLGPHLPKPTLEERRTLVAAACAHASAHGLTTVCSMEYASEVEGVLGWLRAHRPEALTLRVRATLTDREWPLDFRFGETFAHDDLLSIVGYKAFADGTLGSRTARMLEPYRDDPGNAGMFVEFASEGRERLAAWMRAVVEHGFSPAVHAIGDAAVRMALECAEETDPARLLRVEHAQTIHPADIARFAGRVASMQPLHKASDARIAGERLGPARMDRFYPFRRLLDAGARLAFGSDWPIVSLDPRLGIRAAVTGLDDLGHPCATDQNLTVEEAFRAYTATAADALRDPGVGRLTPGAHADLCAWAEDPFEHDWTRGVPALAGTFLGGRVVWRSPHLTGVAEVAA